MCVCECSSVINKYVNVYEEEIILMCRLNVWQVIGKEFDS